MLSASEINRLKAKIFFRDFGFHFFLFIDTITFLDVLRLLLFNNFAPKMNNVDEVFLILKNCFSKLKVIMFTDLKSTIESVLRITNIHFFLRMRRCFFRIEVFSLIFQIHEVFYLLAVLFFLNFRTA